MRTRRCLVACIAMMMLAAVPHVRAQVLDQVPADAMVVIKFNRLKATSDKLAKFLTDLGLAQMVPQMADPLGALEQELKISAGLDRNGDAAFVMVDPDKVGGMEKEPIMLLIPVTDYQQFLGNFPDAKTDGGISEVKVGDSPAPGFVANWGKFAALSPNRAVIENKPSATLKMTALTSEQAASKDVVVIANFATIREKAIPEIEKHREEILAEVESGMKEQPEAAKFAPALRALVNQVINVGEGFLRDSDVATFGVALTGEGLAFTTLADFKPETYSAQLVGGKGTSDLILNGLPAGKYLMYGGGTNESVPMNRIIDDFSKPVLAELDKVGGEEAAAVHKYIAALKAQIAAVKSQAGGLVAPAGNLGQEPIFQFVNVMSGDVKAIRSSYVEMMKTQEDMMRAFGQPADLVKTTFTANAKTIDGVSFDQIQSQFNMQAAGPEAAQAQMMMNYLYGPDGINILVGEVGDRLIVGMGVPESVMSATIASVKGNTAPLADDARTKSVVAQLPKTRLATMFIAVDEIVGTGLTYAKQFGFNMPVQLPPDLPPVGVSISTEATALRVDSYVPSSLVQSLVAAGMQAAMQMQGQGGPGKGGGL